MMNRAYAMFVALVAVAAMGLVPLPADASGLCDQGVSVAGGGAGSGLGWHVGTGQCNGDFTVVSDATFPGDSGAGIELGLRIEERFSGQLNAPQHSGSDYVVQLGPSAAPVGSPPRGWWNFHHSIAYKSPIATLDALTFTIRTDAGSSVPTLPSFDMLALRATIDARIAPKAAGGFVDIYQTSQNPIFGWFTPCTVSNVPGCYDFNEEGAWTLTLTAVKDAQVASVTICVHTPGAACSAAPPTPPVLFDDLRRPNDITAGSDLCGTGHAAINFKGQTGSAGDTWITLYDPTPGGAPTIISDDQTITADVIIKPFNNKKGGGVLALYNEGASKKGLALIAADAGNTDSLTLALVDQNGKLTTLKSVVAVGGITLCNWYRVELKVNITGPDTFTAEGNLYKHTVVTDPSSAVVPVPVATLSQPVTTLSINGLQDSGEVGLIASAVSAVVDTSITNFDISQP